MNILGTEIKDNESYYVLSEQNSELEVERRECFSGVVKLWKQYLRHSKKELFRFKDLVGRKEENDDHHRWACTNFNLYAITKKRFFEKEKAVLKLTMDSWSKEYSLEFIDVKYLFVIKEWALALNEEIKKSIELHQYKLDKKKAENELIYKEFKGIV